MRTLVTDRTLLAMAFALSGFVAASCGHHGDDDNGTGPDACVGLECKVVNCTAMGAQPTTLTGTVYAPNGTLPLYGIDVYVPRSDPGPLPDGVQCGRCSQALPGSPVVHTVTDESGNFKLENVPAGQNIPLVITTGKWRRQITIPTVASCQSAPVPATDTRLPKDHTEGDIPKIAITTGNADALECLIRKLGIVDSEMTTSSGSGRIHLYTGNGASKIGSSSMSDATTLWNSVDTMKPYDILIFSCEGDQNPQTKSQAAMDAVKAYADLGGRVFMSHWHNIWIEGSTKGGGNQKPAIWTGVATWNDSGTTFDAPPDTIDETSNGKGAAFASWMLNVMGSPAGMRDVIPIGSNSGKQTCTGVTAGQAERWVFWKNGGTEFPQNFQFTTPVENAADTRCGKVAFSDMHVSGDSKSPTGSTFPDSCATSDLTPQEKALAFMFFDISSCVGQIF